MFNEDKPHKDLWCFCCLTLTSESWKTFRTVNTAIPSAMAKACGLAILFTSAESLKNIVCMPTQNFMNCK